MLHKVELRVHAGAPSKRTDDERYRAQAAAYQSFTGRLIPFAGDQPNEVEAIAGQEAEQHEQTGVGSDVDVEETHRDLRLAYAIDDSTTVLAPDATVFLDDTQLAYTALESQLFTSSLTIPDVTPARERRSSHIPETSPWPEDLDRHSPDNETAQRSSFQNEARPMSSPHLEQDSQVSAHESPVQYGLGKKRRIQHAPKFKPFKPPLKRSITEVTKPQVSILNDNEQLPCRQALSQADSLSSYLKTPILDRSITKPNQSRTAPLDNLHATDTVHREWRNQRTEISAPPETPFFDRSSKKPKLNDYREHTPQVRPIVPYMPMQEGSELGVAFVGTHATPAVPDLANGQMQSQQSGVGDETTSELPTTYSLSDLTTQSPRARLRASQRSTSDPGPSVAGSGPAEPAGASLRSSSQPPVRVSPKKLAKHRVTSEHGVDQTRGGESPDWPRRNPVYDSRPSAEDIQRRGEAKEPWQAKTRASEHSSSPQSSSSLPEAALHSTRMEMKPALESHPCEAETSHDVHASKSRHADDNDKDSPSSPIPAVGCVEDLPLTIRPPEPQVLTKHFTSHVTEALRFLTEQSVVKDHYMPVSVARDLRPLERGYWLVDASSWVPQQQLDFWQYLEQTVGSGNAGWGIWCCREQKNDDVLDFGVVKVFCWGETVKHVYLMLYVASKSKIRKLGVQWVDAAEEVIVQMRGITSA